MISPWIVLLVIAFFFWVLIIIARQTSKGSTNEDFFYWKSRVSLVCGCFWNDRRKFIGCDFYQRTRLGRRFSILLSADGDGVSGGLCGDRLCIDADLLSAEVRSEERRVGKEWRDVVGRCEVVEVRK